MTRLAAALLLAIACLTGCGAVEQHAADKEQEARLATLEERVAVHDARIKEIVGIVADALARARASVEAARRALNGGGR